jgi:hypothetical protein
MSREPPIRQHFPRKLLSYFTAAVGYRTCSAAAIYPRLARIGVESHGAQYFRMPQTPQGAEAYRDDLQPRADFPTGCGLMLAHPESMV